MLEVKNVTVYYDTALAISDVSIAVEEGGVVSVIGANGAGKSTVLKAIAGLVPVRSGVVEFDGKRIDGLGTDKIVKLGIALVPEGRKLFPYMSVQSNLRLGAYLRSDKEQIEKDLEEVFHLFPRLKERLSQKAGSLSGGEQQMLAIGRALMSKPRLLMMDEPSLGLAPIVIDSLAETIREINQRGVSILLVEQNAGLVERVARRCYVLEVGKIVLEGDIKEMMSDEAVRRAFLG
ncbi:MAG: ABC transporter ATP-binding protein [Thermoleophilia bacterium]|nr:ABC transporter ATP-binding protein [Thermoleophilia bacterium]